MRQPRFIAPPYAAKAYYHCISRVVDRQFIFGDLEKEQFVAFLREYEAFCGVRILTFCVMSNHFHVLVEVPQKPESLDEIADEELLAKLDKLSGLTQAATIRQDLERFRKRKQHKAAEEIRQRLFARMWDISAFMKLLKQRFSQWYNRSKGRRGTLWEERFKSVLVDSAGEALATMAAYIDLNPVRAKIVGDPKDYRWTGYAEAMAGNQRMLEGMTILMRGLNQGELTGSAALARYRMWLFNQAEENEGFQMDGSPIRAGIEREKVLSVLQAKGVVSAAEYVRVRVRYFADGAVLGSQKFVNEIFEAYRKSFGKNRKDGARKMRGTAAALFAMRDLRTDVIAIE